MRNLILVGTFLFLSFGAGCKFDDPDFGPTFEEQLAIDIELIDDFLETNQIETIVHESGIRYVMHLEGTGESPSSADVITVKYEGMLLDETIFDSNEEGYTALLSNLISAWRIMVPEMKVGGSITIYAPSVYCYGRTRVGTIPSNSPLIFEIELISIS